MKMYVGNLAYAVTESELRVTLEAFGPVESVNLVKDRVTGEPIGFAFVEMADRANARAAIAGLNGKKLHGRELALNMAQAGLEVHRRNRRPGVERPD